jgi:hypothetical protein
MNVSQSRNAEPITLPQDAPLLARDEDRLRCKLLFERHGHEQGLDLSQRAEYGSYISEKTCAAWSAWCVALGLPSYLNPNLLLGDWWAACAEKRPPNNQIVEFGQKPDLDHYVQLADGPIWIDKNEVWMLPRSYRERIEKD